MAVDPTASICTFSCVLDITLPSSHCVPLSPLKLVCHRHGNIKLQFSISWMCPPEPAPVQPGCNPHGRPEAEEGRTGLNPVCSPWLQLNGLRTTLNNSSHVNKIIAKTWGGVWESGKGFSLRRIVTSSSLVPLMTRCLAYNSLQWAKMNERDFSYPSKAHTQFVSFILSCLNIWKSLYINMDRLWTFNLQHSLD